jgi:predicted LPLAT superfamily acyltransferase
MTYNPCFLIPIYNHKDTIRNMVERLAVQQLAIFIVDDGSDDATQKVLSELAADYSIIRLYRLTQNGGKGAAVMRGMREAYHAGFSHALQIDADGQHDTQDVQQFITSGLNNPLALICGKPSYDASVPKGRLYGRYITHFWVRIETLSSAIGDSMCGFRLYPLQATCDLINRVKLPERMDFDIEILVRLAWRGLIFKNIATKVIYPPDGLSHFNMLHDNIRITKMHTRLVFGMLLRLPLLLWRKLPKQKKTESNHWSHLSERGSSLGLCIIFTCYRLLGERAARLLLYPIVGYFFLTGKKARAASINYLQKINLKSSQSTIQANWRGSFQHMMAFAQSGLDKLSAWMGGFDNNRVAFPDREQFNQLLTSGQGALLIASHLGSVEMTRALATSKQRAVVNAVVYTDHAHKFNQTLQQSNAEFGVNLIQVSHFGPDTAIMFQEKIDRGEFIVIVGDRTPPAENGRVSQVEFLGASAPFAQGPWILASLLACPVYLFFCLRDKHDYRIYFEPFAERIELPRSDRQARLQAYIQQYALRLEAYCLLAPYQWFNFYDFWRQATLSNNKV